MFVNENSSGGGLYANFKDGKIITRVDGQKAVFDAMTGSIIDIDIRDEKYEGREYRKVILYIYDGETMCQLGFPLSSGYGWSFFQLCGNIDPTKDVTISGGVKDIPDSGGKKYASMFIRQEGSYLKHLMPKDSEAAKKIPLVKEVKVGKTMVKDYEKRDEYMEKVITAFYKKVQKIWPDGQKTPETNGVASKPVDITEPIDDLPF